MTATDSYHLRCHVTHSTTAPLLQFILGDFLTKYSPSASGKADVRVCTLQAIKQYVLDLDINLGKATDSTVSQFNAWCVIVESKLISSLRCVTSVVAPQNRMYVCSSLSFTACEYLFHPVLFNLLLHLA